MSVARACKEIVDFIASTSPSEVVTFRPSEEARRRVADLIRREKEGDLAADERSELDHSLLLEHLMRLAQARARQHLDASAS